MLPLIPDIDNMFLLFFSPDQYHLVDFWEKITRDKQLFHKENDKGINLSREHNNPKCLCT